MASQKSMFAAAIYNMLLKLSFFVDDIELLRAWRENNDRRSREVLDVWLDRLWLKADSLGNESNDFQINSYSTILLRLLNFQNISY